MVYRMRFIICSLFLLLGASLAANEFDDLKSFKADFSQTIINNSGKKIEYYGKVFIKEPSSILWKYKVPIEKNVFINKDFVIIDEPELEQAIFSSLEKEINLIKLIKNAKKVEQNRYKTTLYSVDYYLIAKNNQITDIKYQDELDNKITITFNNIEQNIDIDQTLFVFKAPDYYDIIRK